MKKMKKLDPEHVDLSELTQALEDHGGFTSWWIDTRSGGLHLLGDSMWDGEDVGPDFEPPAKFRRVEPVDSRESYRDLEEFTASVRDPRARDRRSRRVPAVQGHARRIPRAALHVVQIPRRADGAARHRVAARRGTRRRRIGRARTRCAAP